MFTYFKKSLDFIKKIKLLLIYCINENLFLILISSVCDAVGLGPCSWTWFFPIPNPKSKSRIKPQTTILINLLPFNQFHLQILDLWSIAVICNESNNKKTCIWLMGGLRSSLWSKDCVLLYRRLCISNWLIVCCLLFLLLILNCGTLLRYLDPFIVSTFGFEFIEFMFLGQFWNVGIGNFWIYIQF